MSYVPKTNRKRAGAPRTFTDAVMAKIIGMIAQGMKRKEIATALGLSENSLQVTCSRKGISFRRKSLQLKRPQPLMQFVMQLPLKISDEAMHRLNLYATRQGVQPTHVAAELLEIIATDELYDAILDGDLTKPEPALESAA